MSAVPAELYVQPAVAPSATPALTERNHVTIAGRKLLLDELVDPRLFDPAHVQTLKNELQNAKPFEHLVVDGWFNPLLLELIEQEFEPYADWRIVKTDRETTLRSTQPRRFGPAAQLYFGLLNSAWFVELLQAITSVDDLVVDPHLRGGGLHETRNGGTFEIHRDFDRHVRYGIHNEMVFITYLNKGWDPAWGTSLELWDGDTKQCVRKVVPEFGRSILMRHSDRSFHGYPAPMNAPAGRPRRSVAAYYYSNRLAEYQRAARANTFWLEFDSSKKLKNFVRQVVPPIIVAALKRKRAGG